MGLVLWAFGAVLPASALDTLTVYDGTGTSSLVPIYGYYCDAYLKCEYLIPADELTEMETGSQICSLTWYIDYSATDGWGDVDFRVFVKEIDDSSLSGYTGYSGLTGATVVYEGPLDGTGKTITVDFDAPYVYESKNLLIGVYNTAKGNFCSASFYGESDSGVSLQGYSYDSLDDVEFNIREFVPKTTLEYLASGEVYLPVPTNLTVSDLMANSATLSWSPGGEETEWHVAYKKTTDEEWTQETVSDTTCVLDMLEAGQFYDARVQACAGSNASAWVSTQFLTPYCDADEQGTIVYSLSDDYGDSWNGNAIQVVNTETGTVEATLECPRPYKVANGTWLTGELKLCNGVTYNFVWVKGSYSDEVTFSFTTSDGEQIFNCDVGGATYNDGDVIFSYTMEKDLYPRPVSLAAQSVTYNTATLTWTPKGEETAWQVVYASGGDFDPDAVTPIDVTGTPTCALTGLQEYSTYYAYVRANHGEGMVSRWSKVCTFATPEQFPRPAELAVTDITNRQATVTWENTSDADSNTLRYFVMDGLYEDFEGGAMPSGWTTIDADGDGYNWVVMSRTGADGYSNPFCIGSYCIASASYNLSTTTALKPDNWLITPQVQLGGSLVFTVRAQDPSWPNEKIEVYVSTTGTNVEDFVPLPNSVMQPVSTSLLQMGYDLSAYSGMGYIAIRHYDCTDNFMVNIDNFAVINPPVEDDCIVVENATSPCTITGLASGTRYAVQVSANYNGNPSVWLPGFFETLRNDVPPTNLAVNALNFSTEATWDGIQDTYNLRYRKSMVGYFNDFEDPDHSYYNWTLIDENQDNYHWVLGSADGDDTAGNPYLFGSRCMLSWSVNTSSGEALASVDDVAIAPEMELGGTLSLWARGVSVDNPEETFIVYVSTNGSSSDLDDFTVLIPETTTTGVLTEYTVDLSEYAGNRGRIAIRHTGGNYGLLVDNFKVQIEAPGEWTTLEGVTSPSTIEGLDPGVGYDVEVQGVLLDGVTEWTPTVSFTTEPIEDVTLAYLLESGVENMTYSVEDALTMVAQTPDGQYTYVTDGEGNWARVAGVPEDMFSTSAALTNVEGVFSNASVAPTITLTTDPTVESAEEIVLEELNLDDINVTACQVMTVTAYYVDGMLCSSLASEQGVTADLQGASMTEGKQYELTVAIELEQTQGGNGAPRRAQAVPDIKAVVLASSEVVVTDIANVNADTPTDVRYYDAQGRYVGRSLDNAPAGFYFGSNGTKVIK